MLIMHVAITDLPQRRHSHLPVGCAHSGSELSRDIHKTASVHGKCTV